MVLHLVDHFRNFILINNLYQLIDQFNYNKYFFEENELYETLHTDLIIELKNFPFLFSLHRIFIAQYDVRSLKNKKKEKNIHKEAVKFRNRALGHFLAPTNNC